MGSALPQGTELAIPPTPSRCPHGAGDVRAEPCVIGIGVGGRGYHGPGNPCRTQECLLLKPCLHVLPPGDSLWSFQECVDSPTHGGVRATTPCTHKHTGAGTRELSGQQRRPDRSADLGQLVLRGSLHANIRGRTIAQH